MKGVKHNFMGFRGEHNSEALFCLEEFPGVKKKNLKIPGGFQKNILVSEIH